MKLEAPKTESEGKKFIFDKMSPRLINDLADLHEIDRKIKEAYGENASKREIRILENKEKRLRLKLKKIGLETENEIEEAQDALRDAGEIEDDEEIDPEIERRLEYGGRLDDPSRPENWNK